jgi:hypothetical protein
MAELYIAHDDSLYMAHVVWEGTDWRGVKSTQVERIGPYTNVTAIKGNITRFKKNHNRDKTFQVLDIKWSSTEFDWKEYTP